MPFDDAIRLLLRDEVRAAMREELRALLLELHEPNATRDDFLSVKEAAHLARVCPATIRAWLRRGHLKRYGTARLPRVHRADLTRFLATQTQGAQPRSIDEQAALILSRQNLAGEPRAPGPPPGQASPARLDPLPGKEHSS